MSFDSWPLVSISMSLRSVKDQDVVRCNDKIFTATADFDAVETLFPFDDVEGTTRTSVRPKEEITFLDIFDVDL